METRYKIKIIKSSCSIYGNHNYNDEQVVLSPVTDDWETVDIKTRNEMSLAITYANTKSLDGSMYILLEYSLDDETKNEVFKLASDFMEKQKRDKAKDANRRAEAKRKREDSALSRKKKQLEKLKKELGE
jgi:hypothetical protein